MLVKDVRQHVAGFCRIPPPVKKCARWHRDLLPPRAGQVDEQVALLGETLALTGHMPAPESLKKREGVSGQIPAVGAFSASRGPGNHRLDHQPRKTAGALGCMAVHAPFGAFEPDRSARRRSVE